jgi:hypothetical protein
VRLLSATKPAERQHPPPDAEIDAVDSSSLPPTVTTKLHHAHHRAKGAHMAASSESRRGCGHVRLAESDPEPKSVTENSCIAT